MGAADIVPLSVNVPMKGLDEEEQVAMALKASMNRAREEQTVRLTSFIYNRAPDIFIILFFFFLCSFLLIIRGHSDVCILVIFARNHSQVKQVPLPGFQQR